MDYKYEPADKFFTLHTDDPDLPEITIPLPEPPEPEKIDNYGLPPEKQFFRHEQMPEKLKKIDVEAHRYYRLKKEETVTIDQVYDYLNTNKKSYIDEIKWIKKMIHRKHYGCWVYIKGKPFYINRWYWFYLNQWWVDNDSRADGLPDFRDRDWMWWTADLYLYESKTATYKWKLSWIQKGKKRTKYFRNKKDADGMLRVFEQENEKCFQKAQPLKYVGVSKVEPGEYVVDKGIRVNYGLAYPKGRRDGATFRAQCNNYLICTEAEDRKGGIQSKSDLDSQSVFSEKLIKPWQRLWFFFKPYHDGGATPKSILRMTKSNQKRNNFGGVEGIGSWIDYRQSGTLAYDGEKMHFLHHDEVGKKEKGSNINVIKRWQVAKKCLSQGAGRKIVGWALLTSTTNKMEGEGGKEFHYICKNSMYDQRNDNGQTTSGLVVIFIPASVGLEGFVDEHGFTVINTPDEPVRGVDGMLIDIGSYDYIMNTRKDLEEKGDWEALNEEIRQAPLYYRECFRASNKDSGFNLNILNERLQELRMKKSNKVHYDLEWVDGVFGGEVEMIENPEGRFVSTWLPNRQHRNKMERDVYTDQWKPKKINGVAGADPFKFNKTLYARKSNGAGVVFRLRDFAIDTKEKPVSEWKTNKFTTTYKNRPDSKEEFAEDMLKMCIHQGLMMYPENNVDVIDVKFKEWGFGGYLLYYIDMQGRMSPMSGRVTNEGVKQEIFNQWMSYINFYGKYEEHDELLDEALNIGDPQNMKDYDLFTAGGYALMGADVLMNNYIDEEEEDSEVFKIFEEVNHPL